MRATRLWTSFGSVAASFLRFAAASLVHGDGIRRRGRTINCNVAKSSGAVVLHVRVGAVEKADKNGNGTSVDKLLSVLI